MNIEQSLEYARLRRDEHLDELTKFLSIPSISTNPEYNSDVQQAARWLVDSLQAVGLENAKLIPTNRHPLVYADWLHAGPGAPTLLIYGHYDVQPPEPLSLWESPPFDPHVRDEYIYARGASDDKGQLFVHVKAVEAYLHVSGRLPVNVRFIVEGEEESGGESLAAFVPGNTGRLKADAILISDTAMLSPGEPTIVYGTRGICYVIMDLVGPQRDLHSGTYGGGINNPLNALAHIIAGLKDENGLILIPGFYDRVQKPGRWETDLLRRAPLDEAKWLAETGAPATWGEPAYSLAERLGARPTLDVNGMIGGYTGPGGKTVLPSRAHAKISMRLVPDQDPDEIRDLFVSHVRSLTPPSIQVSFTFRGGGRAALMDVNGNAIRAAGKAAEAVFGRSVAYMLEGGTIPIVSIFQEHLKSEMVLLGFGLPGDNIHAPNERFHLPNFYRGIETSIRFLDAYADSF